MNLSHFLECHTFLEWIEICCLQAVWGRAGLVSWAHLLCPKHCLPPWDQDFPRQTPGLLSLSHAGGDVRHVPVHPQQAVTLDSDQTDTQAVAQVKDQLRELRRGYRVAGTIHEVRWRRNLASAVPLQQDWPTAALHVHRENDWSQKETEFIQMRSTQEVWQSQARHDFTKISQRLPVRSLQLHFKGRSVI